MTIYQPVRENEKYCTTINPTVLVLSDGSFTFVERTSILCATAMRMLVQLLFRDGDCFLQFRCREDDFVGSANVYSRVSSLRRPYLFVRFSPSFSNDRYCGTILFVCYRVKCLAAELICGCLYLEFYFQIASSSSQVVLGCARSVLSMGVGYPPLVVKRWRVSYYQVCFLRAGGAQNLLDHIQGSVARVKLFEYLCKGG